MSLKRFMLIWAIMFAAILLTVSLLPRIQTIQTTLTSQNTKKHHFSVVWKGFNPTYSNQTPDYYVCINDLQASVLQMQLAFQIQNNENYSFYFLIDQYQTPPAGWNITSYAIGSVPVDTSTTVVYSNLARVKPSSIPTGTMTETITLVVKAYHDSFYTQFYSQDNFAVQFHFIDRTSLVWTTLNYTNFDDGNSQGWSGYGADIVGQPGSPYRSWPNSFATGSQRIGWGTDLGKTFVTSGPFTEVYLIFALCHGGGDGMTISLNGVTVFKPDYAAGGFTWYQYIIPLPVSPSVGVGLGSIAGYLDDIYVIGK